jgi:hypothetical protein
VSDRPLAGCGRQPSESAARGWRSANGSTLHLVSQAARTTWAPNCCRKASSGFLLSDAPPNRGELIIGDQDHHSVISCSAAIAERIPDCHVSALPVLTTSSH